MRYNASLFSSHKKMQNVTTLEDTERESLPFVPPPPRALNGGLYTGERFLEGAPWANVPVVPDVDYMTNINLRSANPPPQALYQYPGNTRPGNNYQQNTGLTPYKGIGDFAERPYNFSCLPCSQTKSTMRECMCKHIYPISGNAAGQCSCENATFVEV